MISLANEKENLRSYTFSIVSKSLSLIFEEFFTFIGVIKWLRISTPSALISMTCRFRLVILFFLIILTKKLYNYRPSVTGHDAGY